MRLTSTGKCEVIHFGGFFKKFNDILSIYCTLLKNAISNYLSLSNVGLLSLMIRYHFHYHCIVRPSSQYLVKRSSPAGSAPKCTVLQFTNINFSNSKIHFPYNYTRSLGGPPASRHPLLCFGPFCNLPSLQLRCSVGNACNRAELLIRGMEGTLLAWYDNINLVFSIMFCVLCNVRCVLCIVQCPNCTAIKGCQEHTFSNDEGEKYLEVMSAHINIYLDKQYNNNNLLWKNIVPSFPLHHCPSLCQNLLFLKKTKRLVQN